jgi:hypothetical protein
MSEGWCGSGDFTASPLRSRQTSCELLAHLHPVVTIESVPSMA